MMPSSIVTVGLTVRLPLVTAADEVTCGATALVVAASRVSRRTKANSSADASESSGVSGSVSAPSETPLSASDRNAVTS